MHWRRCADTEQDTHVYFWDPDTTPLPGFSLWVIFSQMTPRISSSYCFNMRSLNQTVYEAGITQDDFQISTTLKMSTRSVMEMFKLIWTCLKAHTRQLTETKHLTKVADYQVISDKLRWSNKHGRNWHSRSFMCFSQLVVASGHQRSYWLHPWEAEW